MQFPIFQVPHLGNGMTIALDAVLHVIISHGLAIGAITLIVISEYLGFKKSSQDWENFAKEFLKFTIIITTGVGAVTGAGIWLITSALAPLGIGSMLRVFFWPWFIEWMVFTGEVIFILLYYFTWDKWTGERKKQHIYLGAGYTLFALSSAFLITGILGFMLTSDGWPWDKSILSAFFNPSYLPQLLLRIGIALALGTVFSVAFLLFTRRESGFRKEALNFFGKVALLSLSATVIFTWWYFSVVPSSFKTHAKFAALTSHFSQQPEVFWIANITAAFLLFVLALSAMRGSTLLVKILILPAILISMGFVSEFERIREFIRGPYLMPGYMYANQVLLKEGPFLERDGSLKNSYWYNMAANSSDTISQGAYLFAQNCSACHTIGGINDIAKRVQGRTEDGIFVILGHTHDMVPFMPPFSGTEQERRVMASFLYKLSTGRLKMGAPSRFTPGRWE
ncbi:MAG: c-type cytochrome [Nitrospirae bacterium]|nr:c-type cytochrome [Nitrospirota bacterium]MDA8338419.1 c-type cytochrome [Nitrospiraceae bacterium]